MKSVHKRKRTGKSFLHENRRILSAQWNGFDGRNESAIEGAYKQVLTFVDDHAQYVMAYFMKKKTELVGELKKLQTLLVYKWVWLKLSAVMQRKDLREQDDDRYVHSERDSTPANDASSRAE